MTPFHQRLSVDRASRMLDTGNVLGAIQICQQILAMNERDPAANAMLGKIATKQGKFALARSHLKRATSIAPHEKSYQLLLAEMYSAEGSYSKALKLFDKVLRKHRNDFEALTGKALVLTKQKDRDGARRLLDPLIERGAEDAMIAITYARLARDEQDYPRILELVQRHFEDPIESQTRRFLFAEAAKLYEKMERFDDAFHHYKLANEIMTHRWNSGSVTQRHEKIRQVITPEAIARIPRPTIRTALPIFIVGMPRSGSTLVEQILASHPTVAGAGEVFYFHELVIDMGLRIESILPFPECINDLDQDDVDMLSKSYLTHLQSHAPTSERICDKYLNNYEVLGLLAAMFPEAHFIHTTRHPLDTCLSCYFQQFSTAALAYTEDLTHLGQRYVDYARLMDHWHQCPAINILEVRYEQLITNQEQVTRRMLDHCGLAWNEQCLRYYESDRIVITASSEQVDKPIYTSSAGRYRTFEKHLDPLKAALEEGGVTC